MRAVAHTDAEGTATGNGDTLIRTARFTEIATPVIVFSDHGLLGRYKLPDGRKVTVSLRSSTVIRSTTGTPRHSAPR
jgi:hypothetical protein